MDDLFFNAVEQEAKSGSPSASCNLGNAYRVGEGVEKNEITAGAWYIRATLTGSVDARGWLGKMMNAGRGVPEDPQALCADLKARADRGDGAACCLLGMVLREGWGCEKDYDTANAYFTKGASELGHLGCVNNVGVMYNHGLGFVKDAAVAVEWFRKAAEQGDASAQSNLGALYRAGMGVPKDETVAIEWHTKAAEQGYAPAEYNLALMIYQGAGVDKNPDIATEWFRKAAEQGHADAQHLLAVFYDDGTGVKKDVALATEWYRKAAENGNRFSQLILGMMCDKGWRINQDKAESAKWYLKAARQGLAPAQFAFGCCCLTGCGVGESKLPALHWFRLAAEQGYKSAQYNMGCLLENDAMGGPVDPVAVEWLKQAAEQGDDAASIALARHYKGMPGDENKHLAFQWLVQAAEQGNFDVMNFLERIPGHPNIFYQEMSKCTAWLYDLNAEQMHITNLYLRDMARFIKTEGVRYTFRISEWYKEAVGLDIPLPKSLLEFDYLENPFKLAPAPQRKEEDICRRYFEIAPDLDKEVSGSPSKKYFFSSIHGDGLMAISEECYENVHLRDWHYALRAAYEWIDGDALLAQELCEKALTLNPEHFVALHYKACFLLEAGNLQESLALFQKVTVMRPNFLLAWKNMGVALERCGRYDEAISAYDQAYKLCTYYVMAPFLKGNILLKCRRYFEALEAYKLVCDNDSEGDQVGLDYRFEKFSGFYAGENPAWNHCYAKAVELKQQELFDESMEQAKESLKITLDKYGEEHPDTAASLNLIGELFYCYCKDNIGVRWVRRALAIRVRILGPIHPSVAESLHNIALFESTQMRNNKQAVRLSQQALGIRIKAYGLRNPKVAFNLYILGVLNTENTVISEEARCYAKLGLAVYEAVKDECSWSDSIGNDLRKFLAREPWERDELEVKSAIEREKIKPVLQALWDKYRMISRKERTPETGAELVSFMEDAVRQVGTKWIVRVFSNDKWPSSTIFLSNLPSLPPLVAYALAKLDCLLDTVQLYFAEHGVLDEVAASFLSKRRGPLHIHGLTSLSPESLTHLKKYQGAHLTVNAVTLYQEPRDTF